MSRSVEAKEKYSAIIAGSIVSYGPPTRDCQWGQYVAHGSRVAKADTTLT